jgi:tetratricopeptide (TPR) repeat protein
MADARRARYAAAAAVAAITFLFFLPLLGFPFLNWDDQEVFVRNQALHAPGVVPWAATTTFMEHYQPLAWMAWAAVDRASGLTPAAAHALNAALHALCAGMVFLLARRLVADGPAEGGARAGPAKGVAHGGPAKAGHYGAAVAASALAALVWAVHPLRVEVVAWASAMPYALAALLALAAALAWIEGRAWAAAIFAALSLLSRPLVLALPALLVLLRRPRSNGERAALAVTAVTAVAAAFAESSARLTASLAEFPAAARLTLAAVAPWRYLWRTIYPEGLTPLDPLAVTPQTSVVAIVIGVGGIALVSAIAWSMRRTWPLVAGAWAAYLMLLLPAMGLVPSGLQATADRYAYAPGVALVVALAAIVTRALSRARGRVGQVGRVRRVGGRVGFPGLLGLIPVGVAVVGTLGALSWRQTNYWRDSVSLWSRAVEVDSRNDVALYNLGSALAEAGRRDEAIARYDQALAIVPANQAARTNRNLLMAARFEEEGNQLASRRDLAAAAARYGAAVRLDPRRTHAQAAAGMALVELGRPAEARAHLQAAIDQGVGDPAVPNALAYVLSQAGDEARAIAILRAARQRFPDDPNIARNLASLEQRRSPR